MARVTNANDYGDMQCKKHSPCGGWGALLASSLMSTNAAAQAGFTPVTFNNASVHDPSVVKSGDTYYVFSSIWPPPSPPT